MNPNNQATARQMNARPTSLHQVYVPAAVPAPRYFSAKSILPVKLVICTVYFIIRIPMRIPSIANTYPISFQWWVCVDSNHGPLHYQ